MMYHFNSIFLSTGIDQSQQIQVDDRPAPLALKGRTKDWSRPLEPLPARKRDIGTTADERRPYVRLIRAPVNRGGSHWGSDFGSETNGENDGTNPLDLITPM